QTQLRYCSPCFPFLLLLILTPPKPTLFPYTTLFRSVLPATDRTDQAVQGGAAPLSLSPVAIDARGGHRLLLSAGVRDPGRKGKRSEEHTSELQSRFDLVCRLLLEKKKDKQQRDNQQA